MIKLTKSKKATNIFNDNQQLKQLIIENKDEVIAYGFLLCDNLFLIDIQHLQDEKYLIGLVEKTNVGGFSDYNTVKQKIIDIKNNIFTNL